MASAIVMVLASMQFSVPAVAQDTTIKTKKQAENPYPENLQGIRAVHGTEQG